MRNLDGKKAVKQLKELNFDLSPSITLDANITAPVDAPTSVGTIAEEIQKMMDARDVNLVNKFYSNFDASSQKQPLDNTLVIPSA